MFLVIVSLLFGASYIAFLPVVRFVHRTQQAPKGNTLQYDLGFTTLYAHIDAIEEVDFQSFVERHRLSELPFSEGAVQTIKADRKHLRFDHVEKVYLSDGKSLRVYRDQDAIFIAYNSF